MSQDTTVPARNTIATDLEPQFFAKSQASDELDFIAASREEKTARLRQERLDKQESHRLTITAKLQLKRAQKA
jgi:hypothetical protein